MRQGIAVVAMLAVGLAAGALSAQSPDEPSLQPLPAPSLNFYGSPGLMDMPTAQMLPDGQFTIGYSYFGGQQRLTASFQALPWLSASFRYNGIRNWNLGGFSTYYDRGFDVRFRLAQEGRWRPAMTLGLQDFVGTGVYAAEYLVATKTFDTPALSPGRLPGRLMLTAGVGWGRLGSWNSFGAPLGIDRPSFIAGDTGGEVAYDQWFRGPASVFGGLEWRPDDRWGLKVEYSTDRYQVETEATSVFERRSNVNFGVEYQWTKATRLGAYYMYGSEIGFTLQTQLRPNHALMQLAPDAPLPVERRPARVQNPLAYADDWAPSAANTTLLREVLEPELRAQGLALEALAIPSARQVELRFVNTRYNAQTIAIGRAARVLAQVMPASVEIFRLVPVVGGMGASAVTIRRSDLEALEFVPEASEALRAVAGIGEAGHRAPAGSQRAPERYPNFRWSVGPYFFPSYFDPDLPVRMDGGVEFYAAYRFAPGWVLAGTIRHRLAGNVADGRMSNSVLPRVRTDQTLYAQEGTTLHNLTLSHQWRPGPHLYGRITVGYLERMYAGISTELLWKPVASRLALGVEANYVRQRDYDQRLGLRDYTIATGHASAYLEMGRGYIAQIDAGRYLAGDLGATFTLNRVFANGWSVGGFFTLTDVSAEDFGEGSFDKGVRFNIPVNWFLGKPSTRTVGLGLRPIQRDGGQRLEVPGRLYGQVRAAHAKALGDQWVRIWE